MFHATTKMKAQRDVRNSWTYEHLCVLAHVHLTTMQGKVL